MGESTEMTGRVAPPTIDPRSSCIDCGYPLAGLDAAGVCPECGLPIEQSTRGALLRYSHPDLIARIHQGVFLIQTSIILQIICSMVFVGATIFAGVVGSARSVMSVQTLFSATNFVLVCLQLYGMWLFSEPDPAFGGRDDGGKPRRLVRAMALVQGTMLIVSFLFGLLTSAPATSTPHVGLIIAAALFGLAGFAAWIVSFYAQMLYICWLAPRLPNERVFKRAKRLMWLGPVLYIVGSLILIGPLIALILYWNMLDWIRVDLKTMRKDLRAASGRELA